MKIMAILLGMFLLLAPAWGRADSTWHIAVRFVQADSSSTTEYLVHERAMAAHRSSDVDLLLGDSAAESVISGRGRLSSTTLAGTQDDSAGVKSDLNFGYSWVEMLAKNEGRWLRVGNASSERPQ